MSHTCYLANGQGALLELETILFTEILNLNLLDYNCYKLVGDEYAFNKSAFPKIFEAKCLTKRDFAFPVVVQKLVQRAE